MKKQFFILVTLSLLFLLFVYNSADAAKSKWIRVGKYHHKVVDSGDYSETTFKNTYAYYYFDKFSSCTFRCGGTRFGCKNWTDEHGKLWPVKLAGAAYGITNEEINQFPVENSEGYTMRRYWRYQPPDIVVDGIILNEPFPLEGDEVNPDKIPGTADVMVESWFRNAMGLDIHQRVYGWSQANHDDYIIFEWTIKNTGNIDRDDDIELPNQTLEGLYFMRQLQYFPKTTSGGKEWNSWYGTRPGDSLRITYSYPYRAKNAKYDDFGRINTNNGDLWGPIYAGEATLHADKSATDKSDDPTQPQMHCVAGPDDLPFKHESGTKGEADWLQVYDVMQHGYNVIYGTPYIEGAYPGTHHDLEPDMRDVQFLNDFSWWFWHAVTNYSCGPYTLAPGDSIRIVWASINNSICPEKAWEVGQAWKNETCTWDGADDLAKYYPAYGRYPELAPTANDQAKDHWVCTGKDSLFQSAWAAQWNFQNNYQVPIPPPPPSIHVQGLPDRINVSWGSESEDASDFAGYRVYKAIGQPYPTVQGDQLIGTWDLVFECGDGTNNALTHSFDDTEAERGQAYYYCVTAFDDGVQNAPGANGKKERLESGRFLNRTTQPSHLTRAAGTLSSVRVVPNPFNISARDLQFIGEPDKIMFMDLPPVCTIKIYTESGDLVKTLEHTDNSGDEPWGILAEEHSVSETGQIIVSGIYFAHIETPEGESTIVKFVVVR